MDENPNEYLFATEAECCNKWFSFESCAKSSDSSSSDPKFYPDWTNHGCGKKAHSEFESWELDEVYDTLDECCSDKFEYNKEGCCSSPGMGGCASTSGSGTAPVVYLPDWSSHHCYSKSPNLVATHEVIYTHDTVSECCSAHFSWNQSNCLSSSTT